MTNIELYDRAKKVLESCVTADQITIGIRYAYRAQAMVDTEWWSAFNDLTTDYLMKRIDLRKAENEDKQKT